MKKVVKLTEKDLTLIIKRVINEENENITPFDNYINKIRDEKIKRQSRDNSYMYDREMGRIKSGLFDIKRAAESNDLKKVNFLIDNILMSLDELNKSKNF